MTRALRRRAAKAHDAEPAVEIDLDAYRVTRVPVIDLRWPTSTQGDGSRPLSSQLAPYTVTRLPEHLARLARSA